MAHPRNLKKTGICEGHFLRAARKITKNRAAADLRSTTVLY